MKRAYAKRHDSHKPAPTQPAVPIVASGRVIQLALEGQASVAVGVNAPPDLQYALVGHAAAIIAHHAHTAIGQHG